MLFPMAAKRVGPRRDRRIVVLVSEAEWSAARERARKMGVSLMGLVRVLLKHGAAPS